MKLCIVFGLAVLLTGYVYGEDETSDVATRQYTPDNLIWNIGLPVDSLLGPSDTVYCKIEDNNRHIVYDGYGQCEIAIDRVTVAHRGKWRMYLGLPGAVQLQEFNFSVDALQRGNRPVVTTSVATDKPSVMLSCSVPSQLVVNICKFRDPQNNILIARGIGDGAYTFNGVSVNYESITQNNDCTLRLTNPTVRDSGLWRCGVDTASGTYYGFLTVVTPFAIQDPNVAAIIATEALLSADDTELVYREDEPVVMRCYIPAALRYCYFRARNGTVFTVFPGMSNSNNYGYIGSGLDAGECGIKFNRLSPGESGNWSCHVGLEDTTAAEQRAAINLTVRAQLQAKLLWHGASAVIDAVVSDPYTIDYCRFVRMNGQGFTMSNLPQGLEVHVATKQQCSVLIRSPTIIDLHPWTVAVKVTGQDGEVTATTAHLFEHLTSSNEHSFVGSAAFWLLIALISILSLAVAVALIPRKNRKWSFGRTGSRNSFKEALDQTFHKQPLPTDPQEKV